MSTGEKQKHMQKRLISFHLQEDTELELPYEHYITCNKLRTAMLQYHNPNIVSFVLKIDVLNCLVFRSFPSRAELSRSSHWVGLGFSLSSTHSEVMSMSLN